MTQQNLSQGRIRLSDVARMAGVSTATVSRVLSNPGLVAEATRSAVTQAVRDSGYRMNRAAQNLRKGRTGAVVALVPNLGNPFFAKILDGMGRELAAAGYDLLVADTLDPSSLSNSLLHFLDPSRADGIILLDGRASPAQLTPAPDLPPVVLACEWVEEVTLPRVMLDNQMGGRLAVAHLRALGHLHIGIIGGPPDNVLHRARLEGAIAAIGDARLTLLPGDFSLNAGQAAAGMWLSLPEPERPNAVFAFSDEMACAFIANLMRAGHAVPGEVSVVGFDDIELASHLMPALTTIHQPKRDIGRKAAQVVLGAIAGQPVAAVTRLEPRLMLRETTAPPRT